MQEQVKLVLTMSAQTKDIPRTHLLCYLTAGYALFIAYVSLTPFSGWQEQGLFFIDVLTAPPAQTFTSFDFILNGLSYLPFGFLLANMLRSRFAALHVLLLATLIALLLSVSMEYAQMHLPRRISSNTDLFSNSIGAFLGAAVSLMISQHVWFTRITELHAKWFKRGKVSDYGLALLAFWIFAQINPSLPMLGSVFVSEVARWPFDIVPQPPFSWLKSAAVALNLLLLGILLTTLLRERRHTINALLMLLCAVTLIKFIAAAVLLKSWALLLWLNSEALFGIIAGVLLLAAIMRLRVGWLLAVGALSAVFYIVLMQFLLLDSKPSAAMRLYHWHYMHMLNYNGLSQLVILLFPVLLLGYLWLSSTLGAYQHPAKVVK